MQTKNVSIKQNLDIIMISETISGAYDVFVQIILFYD